MAGASLLSLIDDIASLLDDIALMTKVAARKTAGVLGDDLALNAEQVSGVRAERELPVVWAVAKGSFKNKLILVPAALLLSTFLPWLITPLLMLGGLYLCFEGFEKIAEKFFHHPDESSKQAKLAALADQQTDMVVFEKEKIKGAIKTDFVLSAEIIVIALGTVQEATFTQQVVVVASIAMLMTVGVYGLVAAIVKIDDLGFYLLKDKLLKNKSPNFMVSVKHMIGRGLLSFAPWLMKALAVVGTIAMLLVGGSILLHGIPVLHYLPEQLIHTLENELWLNERINTLVAWILPSLFSIVIGGIAGGLTLLMVNGFTQLFKKKPAV